MKIEGRHWETLDPVRVTREGGVITSIEANPDRPGLPVLGPGYFDPQINGALGIGFLDRDLTPEKVHTILAKCGEHGIAAFAPTLITASHEDLLHGFRVLAKALENDAELRTRLPVFHLEGPFISGDDGPRGAHPKAHVRPADYGEFQRLQEAAAGRIRLVTLAPEVPEALSLIEALANEGVVVSIGHTSGTPQQIRDGIAAGARLSTHLGNGSHAMQPRHENYFLEQLAADELTASIILDGDHLPVSLAKIILRVKGIERLMLTCDAGSLAGLPAGRYNQWGTELEVTPSGKIVVPGTPYLAGSGRFTDHCVGFAIEQLGISPSDAIRLASINTREALGLAIPKIEVGLMTDIVQLPMLR
ncbi:MAG: N-acetylglucosamine-6-phosphate deacetylase [Fimbriiglobus sp.]